MYMKHATFATMIHNHNSSLIKTPCDISTKMGSNSLA